MKKKDSHEVKIRTYNGPEIFKTLGYRVNAEFKIEKKSKKSHKLFYRLVEEFKPFFGNNGGSDTAVGPWKRIGHYKEWFDAIREIRNVERAWTFEDYMRDYKGDCDET